MGEKLKIYVQGAQTPVILYQIVFLSTQLHHLDRLDYDTAKVYAQVTRSHTNFANTAP